MIKAHPESWIRSSFLENFPRAKIFVVKCHFFFIYIIYHHIASQPARSASNNAEHQIKQIVSTTTKLFCGPVGLAAAHPVQSVWLLRLQLSSGPHGAGELFENFHGGVPVDACVGDADTLLEPGWPFRGHLLVAFGQVGLDHYSHNARLSLSNLLPNDLSNLGLVPVILVGVA